MPDADHDDHDDYDVPPHQREWTDQVLAAARLGQRVGGREFQLGFQHDDQPIEKAGWWAQIRLHGARLFADGHESPGAAADALARRIIGGAQCQSCKKIMAADGQTRVPDAPGISAQRLQREGLCWWQRDGRQWLRGCGDDPPPGSTRAKLSAALVDAQVIPAGMIAAARAGRYDDYLSEHWANISLLVTELRNVGGPECEALIARAAAGEFDGTAAESKAWAASPQGQAAFAELLGAGAGEACPGGGNRAQRRTTAKKHRKKGK